MSRNVPVSIAIQKFKKSLISTIYRFWSTNSEQESSLLRRLLLLTLEGDCYIAEIRIIWMSAANLSPYRAVIAQQLVGYAYRNGAVIRKYV